MVFGMTTFTFVHVLLSLIGIASGLIVLYGLVTSNLMNGWATVFLAATLATSVTGFFFPFHGVTPAIILGVLSIIALAAAAAGYFWVSSGGSLATDLRDRKRDRAILQCLRPGRTGLRQGSRSSRAGPDGTAVGTGFRGVARGSAGVLP